MQASRRRTPNTKCVTPARWGNRGAAHGADSNTEFFTDAPGDGCIGKTTEGKTMPDPNSPNGCFQRHGYTVERTLRKSGASHHRAIYDKSGQQVLNRAGYNAEIQFCTERGLMLKDDQVPLQTA